MSASTLEDRVTTLLDQPDAVYIPPKEFDAPAFIAQALAQEDAVVGTKITFGKFLTDYLAQHGVLGMKWGVRNAETRARRKRSGGDGSAPAKRKNNSLAQNPSNRRMTDQELNKLINRLRMERDLASLTAKEMAPESRVKKLLKDVTYDVVKGASTEVGKAILSKALKVEYNKRAKADYRVDIKGAAKDALKD